MNNTILCQKKEGFTDFNNNLSQLRLVFSEPFVKTINLHLSCVYKIVLCKRVLHFYFLVGDRKEHFRGILHTFNKITMCRFYLYHSCIISLNFLSLDVLRIIILELLPIRKSTYQTKSLLYVFGVRYQF